MGEAARVRESVSIGEVIRQLKPDFPDVTISKIRFLEAEGLITPERSPSGYRRFSTEDLDRLRYVLTAQRDHYLPLKVIKEHLHAIDRGLTPPPLAGRPVVPVPDAAELPGSDELGVEPDLRLTGAELCESAGISAAILKELQAYGLLSPISGSKHFDADALAIARTVAGFAEYGLGPRHLRAFKSAADREIGMIDQIVTPLRRDRREGASARADETARNLAALSVRLHATLVRSGLASVSG